MESNTTESIEQIKEFIRKIIDYLSENKLFVAFFVVAFIILLLTYFYSEQYRTTSRENTVLNTLTYTKPREMIDFCGLDNNTIDKMFTSVKFNEENNSIQILNNNINLFDLGLSSEYVILISGSTYNDGFFNIHSIQDKHTIILDDSTKVKIANDLEEDITQPKPTLNDFNDINRESSDDNIEITYYRPNSNINPYKYKKLNDYYISSSHRSFLVGFQKGDYCSLNMINRVIYLGARYVELEIFNKEQKNITTPVIASGYEDGSLIVSLNYIDLKDCLELISQMAFSETHIDNFNDPFFIFLNLKVGDNTNTKNEIARLIKSNLSNRLLSKKFLNTNMGNTTLCELRGKVVIFSSYGWKNTELEEVVNSATDTPHLQRLTFNEMLNYSERSKHKFSIRKNTIRFLEGGVNSEIHFMGNDVDLSKLGINYGDNVVVKGAKNTKNNSGNFLFKVESFSKNKISFDKAVKLANETPGSMISIDVYDASYRGGETTLEEYNKRNLTICVPDDRLLSSNYNPNEAMYRGCQFVTMNYQSLDQHMKNYFNTFMIRAFKFKPATLTIEQNLPKVEGLGALTPSERVSLDYEVDYSFITNYLYKTITISTAAFPNLKLGVNDISKKYPPARMILDGSNKEIEFMVVKGLNGKSDTISLMVLDESGEDEKKYLKFNDNCCYLTYDLKLDSNSPDYDVYIEREKYRNMSFIPLKSFTREEKYNSFGVIMRKKAGNETREVMYYLKHSKDFTPKNKLFHKQTDTYNFKMILYQNNETSKQDNPNDYVAVLRPRIIGNDKFISLGDVVISLSELNYQGKPTVPAVSTTTFNIDNVFIDVRQEGIKSIVVNGAIANPIDFELIFENRNFRDDDNKIQYEYSAPLSIWKPIAPEGFTALGVVFQNSYIKPKRDEIACVSNDFITEEVYKSNFYNNIFDHSKSSINIWNRNLANDSDNKLGLKYYGVIKNVRETLLDEEGNTELDEEGNTELDEEGNTILKSPNPIDTPHFIINLNLADFRDRIYIDNVILNNPKDQKSCNFSISLSSKKYEIEGGKRYDSLMQIDNLKSKLTNFIRNSSGAPICMGLPQAYWSSYYKEVNDESSTNVIKDLNINSKMLGMSCGDKNDFGTNLKMYSDYSIRLSDNNKYCVTHKDINGRANVDIEDDNNFIYLDNCKRDLKNQMFTYDNNRLKVFTDGGAEDNACITLSPENKLRLEQCGDQKFTSLHLWDNQIIRDDKCFKEEADDKLKEVGAIESCINKSYYVIYLQGIFKNEEFCDKDTALSRYNTLVKGVIKDGIAGVVLTHKGNIIKQSMDNLPNIFKNEINIVSSKTGKCLSCKTPSKMLCSNQRMEESIYNSFNNFDEEQRLMKYCMKMRDVDDFRCGRANRQKYIHFPLPEDYCLSTGKMVYLQFPDVLELFGLTDDSYTKYFKREGNINRKQLPVQNLLGEHYDEKNYTVFVKAMIKSGTNNKKYSILFDKSIFSNIDSDIYNNREILKTSEYLCLDYTPKPSMLNVGSKVLIFFDNFYPNGNGTTLNSPKINKTGVKYLGIIIKKHSDTYYRVMLSLNSYESNYKKNVKVGVKYYESNPVIDVNINDITLFNKAEVCL